MQEGVEHGWRRLDSWEHFLFVQKAWLQNPALAVSPFTDWAFGVKPEMSVWADRLKSFSFVFLWRLWFYILHVSPQCHSFELILLPCNLSSGSFVISDRCPITLVPLISSPAPWTASVHLSKPVEHPCRSVPGFSTLSINVHHLRSPLIFQCHSVC